MPKIDAKIQLQKVEIEKFQFTEHALHQQEIDPKKFEFQFRVEMRVSDIEQTISSRFIVNLFEKIDEHVKNPVVELVLINEIKILNFSDVIKKDDEALSIPDQLLHLFNSLVLGHARGIMAAKLQDTPYSKALIPLIDIKVLAPPSNIPLKSSP